MRKSMYVYDINSNRLLIFLDGIKRLNYNNGVFNKNDHLFLLILYCIKL